MNKIFSIVIHLRPPIIRQFPIGQKEEPAPTVGAGMAVLAASFERWASLYYSAGQIAKKEKPALWGGQVALARQVSNYGKGTLQSEDEPRNYKQHAQRLFVEAEVIGVSIRYSEEAERDCRDYTSRT